MSALMDCTYSTDRERRGERRRLQGGVKKGGGCAMARKGELRSLLMNSNSKFHSIHPSAMSTRSKTRSCRLRRTGDQQPGEGFIFLCLDLTLCKPNRLVMAASQSTVWSGWFHCMFLSSKARSSNYSVSVAQIKSYRLFLSTKSNIYSSLTK